MASEVNDGGPAFPMSSGDEPRVNQTTHYNEGMSLRDYFAAKAIPSCSDFQPRTLWNRVLALLGIDYTTPSHKPVAVAERAYAIADAMLAARSKGGEA